MDINSVNNSYSYASVKNGADKNDRKNGEKVETKDKATDKAADKAAVYEKTDSSNVDSAKQIYTMNKVDREAIVKQMKEDMANREQQLVNLVKQMIGKQGSTFGKAEGDSSIWKFLASGNFTVDAETKAQAQADIAEDGYWGVEQTSQRIFDFASALAGDDEEAMRKMEKAFEKGFKQATGEWGKKLPDISSKTYDAVKEKFNQYYESKKTAE